jgi:SEC-C motif-containing protein
MMSEAGCEIDGLGHRNGGGGAMGDEACPCGTGEPYVRCCGPLHAGDRHADTAEALMRSRYSAFAVRDAVYLAATWDPGTRPGDITLDPDLQWTRLRVLAVQDGGPTDEHGVVEFRAHFRRQGEPDVLHERSTFVRRAGHWVYTTGESG